MDFRIETDRDGVAWINGVCITDLDGLEKVALLRAYAEATPDAAAGTWLLEYADLLEGTAAPVVGEPATLDELTLRQVVDRFISDIGLSSEVENHGAVDALADAAARLRAFVTGIGRGEDEAAYAAQLLVDRYFGGDR